jgi:hypothetical protein
MRRKTFVWIDFGLSFVIDLLFVKKYYAEEKE